ncbi:MAG: hypothetical protein V4619_12970 [Bacteroidota bacterium]
MKQHLDIEKAATQTLNSLDNIQQHNANPFLYAKIKQRMEHQHKLAAIDQTRLMMRLAAVLILFIGINGLSFYALKKHSKAKQPAQSGANAFAEAYQLNTNTESY